MYGIGYQFFRFGLILQVFTPSKVYKGQKLTALVNIKTVAIINRMMPKVPEMTLAVYKITILTAMTNLISRSNFPIFVFISFIFSIKVTAIYRIGKDKNYISAMYNFMSNINLIF